MLNFQGGDTRTPKISLGKVDTTNAWSFTGVIMISVKMVCKPYSGKMVVHSKHTEWNDDVISPIDVCKKETKTAIL